MGLILRDVELDGSIVSVRIDRGVIASIGDRAAVTAAGPGTVTAGPGGQRVEVIDGQGGALLRGLHDHHIHVLALAAAMRSVRVGPPEVGTADEFAVALRAAAARGPVRAVGYHERVAGLPDRDALDRIVADTAVRVQHRSGALWLLNSAALLATGLDDQDGRGAGADDPRVERDASGRATGRLWRADDLLRTRDTPIDADIADGVASVGALLARAGVTAVTDATVSNDARTVALLAELPQRVRVMGPLEFDIGDVGSELIAAASITRGEVKLLLDDDGLPEFDATVAVVRSAHAAGRGVAVHCVTLVQLRFALEVLRTAGVRGDRIEHAAVAPPDAIAAIGRLGLAVATQPAFVAERGDEYLDDVDPRDLGALYPIGSLLAAAVPTLGSTDAPYGTADPWTAMRAAVDRRTRSGAVVGTSERIAPAAALALFEGDRPLVSGAPADLVVLAVPRVTALGRLDKSDVMLTLVAGDVVHDAR